MTASVKTTETGPRELDALVAERVFGWTKVHRTGPERFVGLNPLLAHVQERQYPTMVPKYSTDIAAAFLVVEKMRAGGWAFSLRDFGWPLASFSRWDADAGEMLEGEAKAEKDAHAIALAALSALDACPDSESKPRSNGGADGNR